MGANSPRDRHNPGRAETDDTCAGRHTRRFTYVVRWDDTFWGITMAFGVELELLAAANEVDMPAKILAGQELEIPR